ncbi:efflux RND transporter periplasmic adaptor subunit [Alteromonas sp. P256]|uniref:efflux RND transporter periplasmic adaptor subunit n=1 Tax=Alteromonas sp. P256 TaxID=3117399 RepID=UPI002FE26BE5
MKLKQESGRKGLVNVVLVTTGFVISIVALLLVSSQKPFGVSLNESELSIAQSVNIETVKYQENYILSRDFIGQVEAAQTSHIGFEIFGTVAQIKVDEGDAVNKGDIIATLNIDRLNTQKIEAQAMLIQAKANAKLANDTYRRISEAYQRDAFSVQEKDEALQAKNGAVANVDAVKARLNTIEVNINKSLLRAPFDGIVVARNVDEGSVLNVGQTLLTLEKTGDNQARFGLPSSMLDQISVNQQLTAYRRNVPIDVVVKSILPATNSARSFDVIASIIQTQTPLRSGDVLKLPLEERIQARGFWVNNTALREGRRGLWTLYIANDIDAGVSGNDVVKNALKATHSVSQRHVEIIDAQSGYSYVRGSVDDGEKLVTEGSHKLVSEQVVRLASGKEEGTIQ